MPASSMPASPRRPGDEPAPGRTQSRRGSQRIRSTMKDAFSLIGAIVLALVLLIGGVFGYIAFYREAAPRMQEAERDVFVQTPSYVNGKIDELTKYRLDYESTKDETTRSALRREAIRAANTVDRSKLPRDLRAWVESLESPK